MTNVPTKAEQLMNYNVALWSGDLPKLEVISKQLSAVLQFSLDDLLALAISPFLIFGLISFVVESVFGGRESTAMGVGGAVLIGLAIIVPPDLNRAVAVALWQEFNWRIGFEIARPVAVYWGILGGLFLLGAYGERQEATNA